jgi:hypothetical protein
MLAMLTKALRNQAEPTSPLIGGLMHVQMGCLQLAMLALAAALLVHLSGCCHAVLCYALPKQASGLL